jgi:hypothetical protein
MTSLPRARRDTDFAAPVAKVETTTFTMVGGDERVADHNVTNPAPAPSADIDQQPVEWLQATMLSFEEFAFHVPEPTRSVTRSYYPDGELAHVTFLDDDGAEVGAIAIARDVEGRRTSLVQTIADAPLIEVRYAYHDRAIEVTSSMLGIVLSRSIRSLNDQGLVEQKEDIDERGRKRRTNYRYKLNDRGDWIELAIYEDGALLPISRIVRTIEYA